MSSSDITDRFAIRELLENWVLWRDTGDWERFATVWHDDARMITTWYQASASDFIERSRIAWDAGMKVLHTLGGSSIDIQGTRAVSQTKMQIMQRAPVHGVLVDVICYGRFMDALEKRKGRWGLVLRQPIYEMDRLAAVDPAAVVSLDASLLASFPEGYRHLAYLQTQLGLTVDKSLPGARGPALDKVRERACRWLSGDMDAWS